MTLTPRERERLDALVGAYRRLPKAEPSPAIDAAVLANARAAVTKRGRPRWPGLLATAATLTVAVGLAWQLRTADRRIESEATQPVAPAAQSVPAPASAADGALRDAPAPVEDPATSDTALAKKSRAEAARPAAAPATAEPAVAAPARDPGAAPKALAEPFPAQERKAESRQDEAMSGDKRGQAAPALPAEARPILEERMREPAPEVDALPAPPPPAPAPASEAPVSAPAEREVQGKAAETSARPGLRQPSAPAARDDARAATEATGSRREAATESAPSRAAANAALGAAALREPRAWLEDIERLLREGRREQAIAELERFRAAYPDHELPRALRDLQP